jgi:hypothetical protein
MAAILVEECHALGDDIGQDLFCFSLRPCLDSSTTRHPGSGPNPGA